MTKYTIKPLKWEQATKTRWRAETFERDYNLHSQPDWGTYSVWAGIIPLGYLLDSMEVAKELAEKDRKNRLRNALNVVE